MRVELSAQAERDLLDIALYIAADNPDRALSFVDELQQACWGLADRARRYPVLPGFERQAIRRRPHGRYAILYAVADDSVQVLRILSTAMDLDAVLGD